MKIPKPVRIAGWTLLAFVPFWLWYMKAADYGYGTVAGTYTFRRDLDASTLILRPNGTFSQESIDGGKAERADGTWYRSGEAGIEFSQEFLSVRRENVSSHGKIYARVEKRFLGLLTSIVFESVAGGPKFDKTILR